jgi:recombination protein RecR
MLYSPLIDDLIRALQCQPGIGARSAQRIAFHLLERDRSSGIELAKVLLAAMEKVGHCSECRTLCESDRCALCANPRRRSEVICIVESPSDLLAIEKSSSFQGKYFVLMGRLSPLDGIGPKDLGLDKLEARLRSGEIEEVILATNPTVEGEATAHYIADLTKPLGIRTSRIAHGVPVGGELDYVDSTTIAHAFSGRRNFGSEEH